MKRLDFAFLLAFLPLFSIGQNPFAVAWDSLYFFDGSETVHEIMLLADGRLAAVGERQKVGASDRDGFLRILDAATGRVSSQKSFNRRLDDGFFSIAQTPTEGLVLVGFAETPPVEGLGQQGLIVRLDHKLAEVGEPLVVGGPGDDFFKKICWLDSRIGLLAGDSAGLAAGKIWLTAIGPDGKIRPRKSAGGGMASNIAGLDRGPNGEIWACGNTLASPKLSRKGDVWFSLIDRSGHAHSGEKDREDHFGSRTMESVLGTSTAFDGSLELAGETISLENGETDAWLTEIILSPDGTGAKRESRTFGDHFSDRLTAILKTSTEQRWVVVQGREQTMPRIVVFEKEEFLDLKVDESGRRSAFDWKKAKTRSLGKMGKMDVVRLLETFDGSVVVAGTVRSLPGGRSAMRVTCLRTVADTTVSERQKAKPRRVEKTDSADALVGKSAVGERQIEAGAFAFSDDEDGLLSPGEDGTLTVDLRSKSGSVIVDARFEVELLRPVLGLDFHKMQQLRPIVGEARPFSIALHTDASLGAGEAVFRVTLKIGDAFDQVFDEIAVPFGPKKINPVLPPPLTTRSVYVEPSLGALRRGEALTADERTYKTVSKVTATKKYTERDFVGRKDESDLRDQKASTVTVEWRETTDGLFEHTVTCIFNALDTGQNALSLRLPAENFETEVLQVDWQPQKANLHVVVIAPPSNLKFNVIDGRAVAEQLAGQAGNGFFNKVFVDSLFSVSRTDRQSIESMFSKLATRARDANHPRHIKKGDYLVFFYSGHGDIRSDGAFCLLPSNYEKLDEFVTTVPFARMIEDFLNPIKCKKIMLIDACHSGGGAKSASPGELSAALLAANQTAAGTAAFASCSESEESFENKKIGHGAFTLALLEAFSGKAETGENGFLSLGELKMYVEKRVPEIVKSFDPEKSQHPRLHNQGLPEELFLFNYR